MLARMVWKKIHKRNAKFREALLRDGEMSSENRWREFLNPKAPKIFKTPAFVQNLFIQGVDSSLWNGILAPRQRVYLSVTPKFAAELPNILKGPSQISEIN